MKNNDFKQELRQILPLVLSYAADFYKLQQSKNPNKVLDKIGWENFANKCHEGFKLAQTKIINALIEIEEESSSLRLSLKQAKRDRNEKKIKDISAVLKKLLLQKAVFEELANVIVWTIMRMDRIKIKALMQPDMHHKSLLTSNIQSLIETAAHYNKDPNKFALITDIASCVGMGDLIIIDTQKNEWFLTEIKEGKINDIILKTLSKGQLSIAQNYLTNLTDKRNALKFLKQFKRVINQHQKSSDALKYGKVGVGRDLFTGRPKQMIDLTTLVDEKFTPFVFQALKKLYAQSTKSELYFPFDCGIVGLIRNPSLAKTWDFQHFIYHTILHPKSDCAYVRHKPKNITVFKNPEVANHFKEITSIPIYNLKSKVFLFTHEPVFFNIPTKQAVDLFTNKLSIYTYFDLNEFINLCKKANLRPSLEDYEKTVQGEPKHVRDNVVKFEDKCLAYGTKDIIVEFMHGLLFRIICEFQTAQSVIKQMKGMIKYLQQQKENLTN